jgi:predicted Ser/Thr protein kinase
MGSDILDGVYVKNSAKSATKVDSNAVFAKILKDAKEAKSGKTKRFDASDLKKINLEMVQKLVDAGYTEQQVRNIILGYAFDNEIVADNELEYDNGDFSY